jgi:uncharacterized protein YmfQ (DUF2313 family)
MTMAPDLQALDFVAALQACMPRGRVWPKSQDAVQTQVLGGLAIPFATHNARANNLLVDGFPASTVELLPQWEATLGLPDPCAGEAPTIELRQAQVLARFTAKGGQSPPYFVSLAATLGYVVTITQFAPFRFGQSTFGSPIYGEAWAFAWQVNAPTFSIKQFEFGVDAFGEPFAYWDNNVLQCELQRYAPAHTTLLFSYD